MPDRTGQTIQEQVTNMHPLVDMHDTKNTKWEYNNSKRERERAVSG